jgi:hypothetical protein
VKNFKIKEGQNLQLRMEAANFFNHPSFIIGDQTITSSTFGKVTNTFAARRQIQIGLLYRF